MSYKILVVSALCIGLFSSCSKNKAEVAYQKEMKNDSMTYSVLSKTDTKSALHVKLKIERNKYAKTKYDYDVARDQLRTIQEFHLGRTEEKKQKQIQEQSDYIEKLDDSLSEISSSIAYLEKKVER